GNTLRQRYDEVGLPCNRTIGSPSPTSTYAMSLPRTRRRCFSYGNTAEIIIFASPERGTRSWNGENALHAQGQGRAPLSSGPGPRETTSNRLELPSRMLGQTSP